MRLVPILLSLLAVSNALIPFVFVPGWLQTRLDIEVNTSIEIAPGCPKQGKFRAVEDCDQVSGYCLSAFLQLSK